MEIFKTKFNGKIREKNNQQNQVRIQWEFAFDNNSKLS